MPHDRPPLGHQFAQVARRFTSRPRNGTLRAVLGAIGLSAVAGILVTAAVTPVVTLASAAATSATGVFENLPAHLDPGQLAEPSTLYAEGDGGDLVKLAEFYDQDRETVAWDDISQWVKDAAVAEEDPRFYSHGGVDVVAAGRAALQNVSAGETVSGASTITMQYVRNVLIQDAVAIADESAREAAYAKATDEGMDRKLQEMRLAMAVEKEYSKDDILLGYLNIALFGNQVYGIESAAQYYYGSSARDLTLPEAASLIAMVNNPENLRIDDEENLEANQVRRDRILNSMLREGKISEAQRDTAVDTPLAPDITPRTAGCAVAEQQFGLGHFCKYVQLTMQNDPSFGDSPDERRFNIQRGGYDLVTTIDLDLQEAANASVRDTVPPNIEGIDLGTSVVSTEVGTGHVLAMAQNRPFSEDEAEIESDPSYTSVNYSTDYEYGGSTGFQTGSTAKTWTLAEWISQGHSVQERVDGNGRMVDLSSFPASCMDGGVYGTGTWEFVNDGERNYGDISVMQATANSINGGYVSMLQQIDLCETMDLAESLGVHRAAPLENPGFDNDGTVDLTRNPANGFAGTDNVSPLTMAIAYGAIANEGELCTATPITSITDTAGEEVPFTGSECAGGIEPDVAAGVIHALEGAITNGTAAHAASNIGVPHFAKTGTTDDWVDMWTVGASTEVATATWTGNVSGTVNTQDVGMQWAGRTIWPAVMNVADEKYGGDAFPEPPPSATAFAQQFGPQPQEDDEDRDRESGQPDGDEQNPGENGRGNGNGNDGNRGGNGNNGDGNNGDGNNGNGNNGNGNSDDERNGNVDNGNEAGRGDD